PLSLACLCFSFLLMPRPPPSSTLFPYTTLFRSDADRHHVAGRRGQHRHVHVDVGHQRAVHRRVVGEPFGAEQSLLLPGQRDEQQDRKSTRLNSSHVKISYAVFCLKKKKKCYLHS